MILVTGITGYEVVVFDNFCNSSKESIKRVGTIINKTMPLIEGDIVKVKCYADPAYAKQISGNGY